MDADLEPIVRRLKGASTAEDLFCFHDVILPPRDMLERLSKRYEELNSVTSQRYSHPEDVEAAREAQSRLERFYAQAQTRISENLYGLPGCNSPRPAEMSRHFDIGPRRYWLGAELPRSTAESFAGPAASELSFYPGFLEESSSNKPLGRVLISRAKTSRGNELLGREARTLALLHEAEVPQWKHLPLLLDRFQSGGNLGLIAREMAGHSAAEVKVRYPRGIDQQHMLWIADRALSCLGFVHRCGVLHGAVSPYSLHIQAESHNVFLTQWGNAVLKPAESGERVKEFDQRFAAPELSSGGPIGPWTDLYALGALMVWLIGGEPEAKSLPASTEERIAAELLALLQEDPRQRPSDAWEVYAAFSEARDALWPRQFRHFDMS